MLEPGTVPFSRPLQRHKIVFIVEDVVSLIRVGKTHSAMAVLSTAIASDQLPVLLQQLTRFEPKRVLVALDPDAWDKAKKMEELLTRYWNGVKAIRTDQDPKYWSDEQLDNYARS